ncbi:osmotically inducible lipoprotein OsmB [Burkholderia sp. WP9]|uniref:glycine zipper 2TM domain-containing protein n=1 Tax=Burkholderia sp. WP9 TaxID=1500263 RepID=UPI000899987A|nr:glycine zipper 2TM domain-containing protein [Burkholderia sp. WP9]SEB94165.1 osmotically inducible lipoprotein OsmB [Burkholderia sp. WP9]
MKKFRVAALFFVMVAGLSACDNMSGRQRRDTTIGAVGGGVAGALLGDSAIATVGGAAIGGLIGNEVGKSGQSRRDR